MPEWRDLLLVEGGAGSDRTMASALQHGAAAFVARLQATGATSYLAEGNGAWRYGKRCAFPTSPHPRLRLRTRLEKGATLTFHLVQKIGQVSFCSTVNGSFGFPLIALRLWFRLGTGAGGATGATGAPVPVPVGAGCRTVPCASATGIDTVLVPCACAAPV